MEDTTGAFLLSAMAMFIEAIDLLAAPLGRRLETKLHSTTTEIAGLVSRPTAPALIPFASLQLVPAPAADAVYSPEVFLARRTSPHPVSLDTGHAICRRSACLRGRDLGTSLHACRAHELGPRPTGMNVSMSLVDVGILKSIGADEAKLVNTLKLLGPKCSVPCDQIPRRSWPLFRARDLLRGVIESFQLEQMQ